ncbi:hypothetical protein [Lentimicrobium sp.]|jgi:hypothetical protein|uniref:hypothetical protein n=1 Tax=Lentimicrobium sp. TaxID=2034841 RepID=UPI002C4ED191|nr:hypothetical protein [Lentimicrobium sp.]HPR27495.1 hypothetical protein [Lentimicrobium sp.]
MKADKKTTTDHIEKEMKLLIEKLNNENAALGKILMKMAEEKEDKDKPPGDQRREKPENQRGNQHSTE